MSLRRRIASTIIPSRGETLVMTNNDAGSPEVQIRVQNKQQSELPSDDIAASGTATGFAIDSPTNISATLSSSASVPRWWTSNLAFVCGIVVMIAPWSIPWKLQSKVMTLREGVNDLQVQQKKLMIDLKRSTDALKRVKDESYKLQNENKEMLKELKDRGDNIDPENSLYSEAEELEEEYVGRIDKLEATIQKRCLNSIMERYDQSMGPFMVKITLRSEVGDLGDSFTIKTARADVMPHSLNYFLQTVEMKLWDGLSLHHKVDAGSKQIFVSPVIAKSGESADERFDHADLTKLIFTEHSDIYPVEQYSVAFAGRPGGPEFFIQMDHRINASMDVDDNESSFGKVVDGQPLLDYIVRKHRKPDFMKTFTIDSMKIVQ